MSDNHEIAVLSRAQGCLLGQCAGDALGQLVEFRDRESILAEYPNGVRDMKNGGAFNTIAGQPTDDTELALMLARSIVKEKRFDPAKVFDAYRYWYESGPFDCGHTTVMGLARTPNELSQANGSLMRISPLGIYGSRFELDRVAEWAMQDSRLTHPHIVCQKACAVYATTIAEAVREGFSARKLYDRALERAKTSLYDEAAVRETLERAFESLPERFYPKSGWVLVAFQNAFYHLVNTNDPEKAIIETVSSGGDTDTNGAICGALLGAVHGMESIPVRWRNTILNCKPSKNNPEARHPRPECFWPVDVPQLSEELLRC